MPSIPTGLIPRPRAPRLFRKRVPPEDVSVTTPPNRWFTLEHGWPVEAAGQWTKYPGVHENPPSNISPTVLSAPSRRPLTGDVIGELYVEVLEARNIPSLDLVGSTDAFAMVLFEGIAARTSTICDSNDPKWPAGCARALRLPIQHPSSDLKVALFDDDGGIGVASDEAVGRVVVSLGGMHPRTQFDVWLPLQRETFRNHAGKAFGQVRLRYRIEWGNDRAPLLRALRPLPEFVIPFTKQRYLEAAHFTTDGHQPETVYSWSVLMAMINIQDH